MNLVELNALLEERHLEGHWNSRPARTDLKPFRWNGEDIVNGLLRAAGLVSMESVAMRLIQPRHPDLPWGMSNTIHCTVQVLMPGERTRAHRNLGSETRFVIKAKPGAVFVVEGEPFPMEPGDFITTPNWAAHDHYNDSDEPAIWLDGMENRLVSFGAQVGEPFPGGHQPLTRPEGYSQHALGRIRPAWLKSDLPTPPFRYRWADSYAALQTLKETESEGDPDEGIYLRYANPVTGGPTLPTRTFGLHLFAPSQRTRSHRRNCSTIYYAVRGQGALVTEDERLDWSQGDLLVVPPWNWYAHENASTDDAILFSVSDQPALQALKLYREESQ